MPAGDPKPVKKGQYPEYKASYQNPAFRGALAAVNPVLGHVPKLLDMISPTARKGHPFTAVDNKPSPTLTAAVGDLMHLGAALFGPHETDARIYKKAVLDRQQQPITEKDFTPAEIAQLAGTIDRSTKAGRSWIRREDHFDPARRDAALAGPAARRAYIKQHGEMAPWNHIIGRARFEQDGDRARVIDSYDFNRYENTSAALGHPLELMAPHIWLGRRALPSGLRGTPVDIRVPLKKGLPKRYGGN